MSECLRFGACRLRKEWCNLQVVMPARCSAVAWSVHARCMAALEIHLQQAPSVDLHELRDLRAYVQKGAMPTH